MRCSNCSAPLLDGTPVCSQCGHVNEDAGRAAERTPAEPAPAPARGNNLRARLGAPKPAAAPAPDDSTAIGTPRNDATDAGRAALPDPEIVEQQEKPKLRRPGSAPAGPRAPMRRPGTVAPAPASRTRRAESTEPDADPDDADTSRPPASARVSRPKMAAAPRRFADPAPDDDEEDAPPPTSKPRMPAAGPRPLVQPGKYATVGESRASEGTLARPELASQQAGAPPPANPDEILKAVLGVVKSMSFEDKLESFSAAGLILMVFMPWRTVRGEDDIGLLTWAGFLTLLFACGVIGLIYLRFTGRVPTITSKMLATAELALSAVPLLFTLIFMFTSIDRTTVQYGSLKSWTSMPAFGAVISLLVNFALCAGSALVFQRESKQGAR